MEAWVQNEKEADIKNLILDLGEKDEYGNIHIEKNGSELVFGSPHFSSSFKKDSLIWISVNILNTDEFREEKDTHAIGMEVAKKISKRFDVFLILVSPDRERGWNELYLSYFERETPTHITSINYFGSDILSNIGEDLVRSAPAYEVSRIDQGYALQALERYNDWPTSDRRKELERHLEMKFI